MVLTNLMHRKKQKASKAYMTCSHTYEFRKDTSSNNMNNIRRNVQFKAITKEYLNQEAGNYYRCSFKTCRLQLKYI